ncbi:hypothetical protein GPALN_011636 [Globodera pallida]|nr:hypothetical protein GPALN_011636 [Globodera pallida]
MQVLPTLLGVMLLLVVFGGTFGLKCKEGSGLGPLNGTIVECPTNNNSSSSFCMQIDCNTNNALYPVFKRFKCSATSVQGDCTEKVKAMADMGAFAMDEWACECKTEHASGGRLRVGVTVFAAALAAAIAAL